MKCTTWQRLAKGCALFGVAVLLTDLDRFSDVVAKTDDDADFVVCGVWQTEWSRPQQLCSAELVPLRMRYFFNHLAGASEARVRAGSRPVLLHIGVNHFGLEALFDGPLFERVAVPFRVAAIEPDDTWNTAIGWGPEQWSRDVRGRVQLDIANVAVASGCTGQLDFHRYSYQLAVDYNLSYRDWVDIGIGGAGASLVNLEGCMTREQTLNPTLQQMHNASLYKQSYKVPCWTPAQLFGELQLDTQDLVFVSTDAETLDDGIVDELLDAGARPKVWVFETDMPWSCYSEAGCAQGPEDGIFPRRRLVPKLRRCGYRVGKNCEHSCIGEYQENIVAVRVHAHDEI